MNQNLQPEQLNLLKILEPELNDLCVKFAIKGGAFLSTIFYSVQKSFSYDLPCAGTNGRVILFNPNFFAELNKEERLFVIAHEVLHIAFLHFVRQGNRDQRIWNMAGDYVINYELQNNFDNISMPDGALYDWEYRNMTTEEVYDVLIQKDPEELNQIMLNAKFGMKDIMEDSMTDASGESHPAASKDEVTTVLVQAEQVAQMQGAGNFSNTISKLLEAIKTVKIDWYTLLIDYVSKRIKDSYSFTKRNRRYSHMYLPSMNSLGMGTIAVYMDVSSSVEIDTLRRFLGAIQDIKDLCKPELLKIVPFNTELLNPYLFNRDEEIPINLDFDIYGGTDINPCLKDMNEQKYDISIVFSDGYFMSIDEEIPESIFWTIYDDSSRRFNSITDKGTIIYVD